MKTAYKIQIAIIPKSSNSQILKLTPGPTGFDSIDLCKCKHVVRWIIST